MIELEKERKKVSTNLRGAALKRYSLRRSLWGDVEEKDLWLRQTRVGFTTVPRTLSLIGRIMDQMSGKGFPLFGTYFSLWCRVFDEGFVEIRSEKELAFESGFTGTRGVVTWRSRMRRLEELGFISTRRGLMGDFQYVLLLNPIHVIYRHYQTAPQDIAYNALVARLAEVGADDLLDVDSEKNDADEQG